ncbi:MAG: ATP-binding protein [Chitinophagaceae bacterium]
MKILTFIIAGFAIAVNTYCQDYHRIDSLKQILNTAHDDQTRGLAISELSGEYMWTQPDTCLYYTNMGLDLIRTPSIKSKFEISGNPFLRFFEIRMYSVSATALSELRNDSLAVKMGLIALRLAEQSKDKTAAPRVYVRLAEVYQNIEEPSTAITYFRKLLTSNTDEIPIWIASLGTCFYDLGNYDSALFYLNKIDPGYQYEPGQYWPVPAYYLGKIYARKDNYEKAIFYFRTAIRYAENSHLSKDLCDAYIGISRAFSSMNITDSALLYIKLALKIANDISLPSQNREAYSALSSIYEFMGNTDSAFKYQKIALALQDSLLNKEKIKQVQNYIFNERLRQLEITEQQKVFQNKIRTYSLVTALLAVLLIAGILLRNNRHKQKLYGRLQLQKEEIQNTLAELEATQTQLIQSEKMASLGELTAGIAHEIQNPLNFVNNFSEVNKELLEELKSELAVGNLHLAAEIADDLKANSEKINHHGKRADSIVKGMLQHSQKSVGEKIPTNINALADEYLRLAYHGIRAKDKSFNAKLETDFDVQIDKVNIISQDIGRVVLNILTNAFYAVNEKKKFSDEKYYPTVIIRTKKLNDTIEITVSDNGNGIPQNIVEKIFQPFFTTKPTGQGTGLGLSLAYDIVKAHGGGIKVETKEGEGSEFVITLPSKLNA